MEQDWIGRSLVVAIGCTFFFLFLFQCLAFLKRQDTRIGWVNFRERIRTWWLILVPLTTLLLLGPLPLLSIWCFLSSLAVYELLCVAPLNPVDKDLKKIFIASPWLLALCLWLDVSWIASMSALMISIPTFMIIKGHTEDFLQRMSYMQWILVQIVGALSFGALLIIEAPGSVASIGQAAIIAWVLFIVQMHDAMQYCVGKLIGKHRILPHISPKKTWEGLIGGLLVTSFFAALLSEGVNLSLLESFFVAAFICLCGFISDVMMSGIKRGLGIKDYGFILKGHGGILDRMDSLLLSLPMAYILLNFLS